MLSPNEFVDLYRNVQVNCLQPFYDPPIWSAQNQTFAIVRYVSGLTTYTQSVRTRMRKFLNKLAEQPDSGVVGVSTDVWNLPSLQVQPIFSFSDDAINRALNGRGSIWEIQTTLRIASLMMATYDCSKDFYGAHDLQVFVNYFLGMDCNGFVGAYLREIAGAGPKTGSKSCAELASGPQRTSHKEIRERDFIYHHDTPNHVSIIGTVTDCDDKWVYCNICEARSPKFGGVQSLPWKIQRDGAGWKMYRTDMNGASVHRTWIARNPMVD